MNIPLEQVGDKTVGIRTALATTSKTQARLRTMQKSVGRAMIGADTREALLNDLAGLADAYAGSWESGSDLDSDLD